MVKKKHSPTVKKQCLTFAFSKSLLLRLLPLLGHFYFEYTHTHLIDHFRPVWCGWRPTPKLWGTSKEERVCFSNCCWNRPETHQMAFFLALHLISSPWLFLNPDLASAQSVSIHDFWDSILEPFPLITSLLDIVVNLTLLK